MRIIDGNIFEGMRMIIPEHRAAMLKLEQEKKRIERPQLDQDKLELMSRLITEAIQDERCVTVTVYAPYGEKQIQMVPSKVDLYARQLLGHYESKNVSIPIADIVDICY
jgi:sulfur transfer complex TusBCD TusB component (DsrH family)